MFQIMFTAARRQKRAARDGKDLRRIGIRKTHNEAAGLGNNRELVWLKC